MGAPHKDWERIIRTTSLNRAGVLADKFGVSGGYPEGVVSLAVAEAAAAATSTEGMDKAHDVLASWERQRARGA